MIIPTLLLSLAAGPELTPSQPIFSCTVSEHTFVASNLSERTLVVSFASADRAAVLHLAVPASGRLGFRFPAQGLRGCWLEVSSLSAGQFVSTGALLLQGRGDLHVFEQDGALESSPPLGTLLPAPLADHVTLPSCTRALDVGVPPPAEDPVVDEVSDLRRRIRRPI